MTSVSDEKDRLGEKLHDVEAAREDQWAKKRDSELLQKMREKLAASAVCPNCKRALVARAENGIGMLSCPGGHGAWLDEPTLKAVLKAAK